MKTVQELIRENRTNAQFLAGHARRVRIGMRFVSLVELGTALGLFVIMRAEIFVYWPFSAVCFCGGVFLCDSASTDWRKGNRYWDAAMKERDVLLDAANLLEKCGLKE